MTEKVPNIKCDVTYLLELIPKDKNKAVTYSYLCMAMGCTKRQVRDLINKAKNMGNLIVNFQNGKGFYISDDIGEIKRYYIREHKRFVEGLKSLKPYLQYIKEHEHDRS